ncbi:hypothetical protein CRV08_12335 [Halarcobacter ebronensis]|uniref:Methyltransferase FkbM domain-containing protein n=1 Tax=Halarcobacter ebronensis TaxID=1462615 RepID=A0A4Q0YCK6_9BACT|nr:FkbM family methyltransferase [Halarcobacter ebronensis]RXJ66611.1 hypothetical protein CRV08_12335 [Halarcobacter ebronensis]
MTMDDKEVKKIAELFEDSTLKLIKEDLRWEAFTPVLLKELKKAKLFIDIGAEYGYYINMFLKYSTKDSKMIAIEAEPDRSSALINFFSDNRVEILPLAISEKDDTLILYKYEGKSASADKDLSQWNNDGEKLFFEIESKKLDTLLKDKKPDIIKMDIEGAEIFAFQGMEEVLEKSSPTIFLEYHDKFVSSININGKKIIENVLKKYGYEIYDHKGSKTSLEKGRVIIAKPEKAESINFIGINYKNNLDFSKNFNAFYETLNHYQKMYSKLIIYGAGTIGQTVYKLIDKNIIVSIVDRNKDIINNLDCSIKGLEYLNTINNNDYDKILITVLGREEEIIDELISKYNINPSKFLMFNI